MKRLLISLALVALAHSANAATIEVGAGAGLGRTFTRDGEAPGATYTAGGLTASASFVFRSDFPLSPWVELGHAELSASRWRADGVTDVDASMRTQYGLLGPALDLGRLRLRAGIGLYRVQVTSTVLSVTTRPASTSLGWFLAASFDVLRWDRVRIAPEVRALLIEEGSTVNVAATLNARFDLARF